MELSYIEKICSLLDLYVLHNETIEKSPVNSFFYMDYDSNTTASSKIKTDKYEAYDLSSFSDDIPYSDLNLTDVLPMCRLFEQKFQSARTFNFLRYNLIKYLYPILFR